MGLYLVVFDDNDDELDAVEVGMYSDYGRFLDTVISEVEGHCEGSVCPTLILHSDCDGEWTAEEAPSLEKELLLIKDAFQSKPASTFEASWQIDVAKQYGLRPANLYESFIDVDGENLIERLLGLVKTSRQSGFPILFQ